MKHKALDLLTVLIRLIGHRKEVESSLFEL